MFSNVLKYHTISIIMKSVKLAIYLTETSSVVVLLVRASDENWRICTYNTTTNLLTKGQWLKNKIIKPLSCDISNSSKYMLIKVIQYKKEWQNYTILCRPPYFTADYFWDDKNDWSGGGGGSFLNDNTINIYKTEPGDHKSSSPTHFLNIIYNKHKIQPPKNLKIHSGFNGQKPIKSYFHTYSGKTISIGENGEFIVDDLVIDNFQLDRFEEIVR